MPAVLLACLLGFALKAEARKVTPFNDGWEFKKGPFAADAMQVAAKWNADWQQVTVPHTWNADDMQKQTNSFYAQRLSGGDAQGSLFGFRLRNRRTGQVW